MTDQPIRIFIAYAHEDDTSRDKLRRQLNVLERRGHFQIFWDGLIQPGGRWDTRLKDELHRADIFLLLVSEAFLDSDYVHEVELPKALQLRPLASSLPHHKTQAQRVLVRVCDPIRAVCKSLTCEVKQRASGSTSRRLADSAYRVADPHEQ